MVRCIYGKPTARRFHEMLRYSVRLSTSAAVYSLLNVRYLESASRNTCVAVITRPPEIITCAKIPTPDQNIFVIFDTHPRPAHPDGSGITYLSTIKKTAQRLSEILSLDKDLLSESDLQWQVQLLANFSAHIFVPNDKWDTDSDDLTQALLGSSLTILALQAQLSDLTSSVREATQATSRLEKENVGLQETVERLRERLRTETRRPPPQATQRPEPRSTGWFWSPWQSQQANTSTASTNKVAQEQDYGQSLEYALSLQREFDEENRQLERERLALHATAQAVFDCSICLDTFPMDDAARVPGCRHLSCRDCLRQHVLTTLHDHRFLFFVLYAPMECEIWCVVLILTVNCLLTSMVHCSPFTVADPRHRDVREGLPHLGGTTTVCIFYPDALSPVRFLISSTLCTSSPWDPDARMALLLIELNIKSRRLLHVLCLIVVIHGASLAHRLSIRPPALLNIAAMGHQSWTI